MGKKKGAGNKLARMSEEERARYLQHRAEIEEENRRRKQQLIAIFMKNKLKKEEAFSRLNMAKINQEWRSILRNIKCTELREEIKSVEEYFNDALDRKNRTIQRLLGDLDENEEQYSTMLHTHLEHIEMLIGIHSERVTFWKRQYREDKRFLLDQYSEEIRVYKERKENAQIELEEVYYGLKTEAEKEKEQNHEHHMTKIDNIKSNMMLKLDMITQDRELKMEDLWKQFQEVLNDYLRHTEEFHNEYVELRQKDDEDTRIIRIHYAEVAKCTDLIADMKFNLDTYRTDQRLQVNELKKYKKMLQDEHIQLKTQMEIELKKDKDILRFLVVCCNKTASKFKKLFKQGERILQMALICKKMENENEKSFPFRKTKTMLAEVSEKDLKSPISSFKEETMEILSKMEHFWIRFNNARIDYACLNEEKQALKRENDDLRMKLKVYLTNVTISGGSGGNARDRLRPTSMKIERIPNFDLPRLSDKIERRRPVTCIEGNLSVAVRSQMLIKGKFKMPQIYSIQNYD